MASAANNGPNLCNTASWSSIGPAVLTSLWQFATVAAALNLEAGSLRTLRCWRQYAPTATAASNDAAANAVKSGFTGKKDNRLVIARSVLVGHINDRTENCTLCERPCFCQKISFPAAYNVDCNDCKA